MQFHLRFLGSPLLRMASLILLAAGMSLYLAMPAAASVSEEIKLPPVADTFVSSLNHDRSFWGLKDERTRNFGGGDKMSVIRAAAIRGSGPQDWRGALIRFDLSAIPPGAEITDAQLFLYHANPWGDPISIHRLNRPWTEMGATWVAPCQGCEPWWQGWESGNYRKEATDTKPANHRAWIAWAVTADVRSFLTGTPNYGWFLNSALSSDKDPWPMDFYSKECRYADFRPYLRISYRLAPPPLSVKITSPANGATLNAHPVNVSGTVSGPAASVTVNGVTGSISGQTFQALVNLNEGANSIIAVATDQSGKSVSDRIDVTLITKGSIAGIVTDSSGMALSAAAVSVTDSLKMNQSALTGNDGKFSISNVASGAFTGSIKKDGYSPYNFSGTVSPGQTAGVNAALSPILPKIGNIAATNISPAAATITWVTDQPADSLVEYGTSLAYGNSVSDSALAASHQINLAGLKPATLYHYRVTSRNAYGFSASSGDQSFTTLAPINPIALQITFPKNDDTISRLDTRVEGTVTNSTGSETGVVVNGVLAMVSENQFVANHVPLVEGPNPITATATDGQGNVETAEITVSSVKPDHYITITANVSSGITPLEAVLTLNSDLDLAHASLTCDGPGQAELVSKSQNEYQVGVTVEGTYRFTARVNDSTGVAYEDTLVLIVLTREEMNTLLTNKWGSMRTKLANGDIDGSLTLFSDRKKERYRNIFSALVPVLPRLVQEMSDIQLIEVYGDTAIYDLRTVRDGVEYSFQLLFTRDPDGIWKITSF